MPISMHTNNVNCVSAYVRVREHERAFGIEFFSKDATNATSIEARN